MQKELPKSIDKNQEEAPLITKVVFDLLASYQDVYCISITIPRALIHSDLEELILESFKGQFDLYENQLQYQGLTENTLKTNLRVLQQVFFNWKNSDSNENLVVFISTEFVKAYLVPIDLKFKIYLNNHFYLKSISPLFNSSAQLLILHIEESKSKLFALKNIELEKHAEIHSDKESGKLSESYIEIITRQIRITKREIEVSNPTLLVIVGRKSLVNEFLERKNSDLHFFESFYFKNELKTEGLKDTLIPVLNKIIKNNARQTSIEIKNNRDKIRLKKDLELIVKESSNGKIDSLFIEKDIEVFGEFDEKNDFVMVGFEGENLSSLTNVAAVQTILNNGNVFLLTKEEMPLNGVGMNAIIK